MISYFPIESDRSERNFAISNPSYAIGLERFCFMVRSKSKGVAGRAKPLQRNRWATQPQYRSVTIKNRLHREKQVLFCLQRTDQNHQAPIRAVSTDFTHSIRTEVPFRGPERRAVLRFAPLIPMEIQASISATTSFIS